MFEPSYSVSIDELHATRSDIISKISKAINCYTFPPLSEGLDVEGIALIIADSALFKMQQDASLTFQQTTMAHDLMKHHRFGFIRIEAAVKRALVAFDPSESGSLLDDLIKVEETIASIALPVATASGSTDAQITSLSSATHHFGPGSAHFAPTTTSSVASVADVLAPVKEHTP